MHWVYSLQIMFNDASPLAVIQSVIDSWNWVFTGSNAPVYPSLIIFAASLRLVAHHSQDKLVLDKA